MKHKLWWLIVIVLGLFAIGLATVDPLVAEDNAQEQHEPENKPTPKPVTPTPQKPKPVDNNTTKPTPVVKPEDVDNSTNNPDDRSVLPVEMPVFEGK